MYQSQAKSITYTILRTDAPITYKSFQLVSTEDSRWIILEHVLYKIAPHLGGKEEDIQENIYDLRIISSEDLASFINRSDLFHKNVILSRSDVSPNILFEQLLTQLMACHGFPPFLGTQ